MSNNYNAKLAQEYEELRTLVQAGRLPMEERIEAIDESVTSYVISHAKHYDSERVKGRNPPINYKDSRALERMADLILHEDLTWSHPDKMSLIQYPVMSERQRKRRFREIPSKDVFFDRKDFAGSRTEFSTSEEGDASLIEKAPIYTHISDVLDVQRDNDVIVARIIKEACLTTRQMDALRLVYYEDMTQEGACKELGISRRTLRTTIDDAMTKLRATNPPL